MLIIGIDTGGTFTDFIIYKDGKIKSFKILSTPKQPEKAIIKGLKPYLRDNFILIHGTTVATNAFLENKMGKTALLITKGFKDILKIGRQNRINLFSLKPKKPNKIIDDKYIFEVNERTLYTGEIIKNIDKEEIGNIIESLKAKKIESVAILFLHSYINSKNEEIVKKILESNDVEFISVSSEIFPEYREYERGIITILNGSLMPPISDYMKNIDKAVKKNKLYIMQSNGGVLSPVQMEKEPVRALLSGPSGGLIAVKKMMEKIGENNIITLDMGGTSTDVSVIKEGKLSLSKDRVMNNLKIKIPMLNIETVGAGGGSIARVDRAGVLQVGPESAGAFPGPACYGKSELPTITDAFIVLNVIDPKYFLGGKMKIYPEKSFKAINKIAKKIGKSEYETAEGIVRISVSSIERALRTITVERGDDPRFFTLVPFGGAGGLVISYLAANLDINKIIIPFNQGVFSAFGMIFADFTKEFSKSVLKRVSKSIFQYIEKEFKKMEESGRKILKKENIPTDKTEIIKYLDMRYKGQSYELSIEYDNNFMENFHKEHKKIYSYSLGDEDIEIVNMRLIAKGKIADIKIEELKNTGKKEIKQQSKQIFYKGKFRKFFTYKRKDFSPGDKIRTPAIILSEFSTILIDEMFDIKVDEFLNLILERKNERFY